MSASVQFDSGKYADRFARRDARVVDVPHFRPLVLRVPDMACVAEREDALLGARLLLVTARPAEGGVEAVFVERLAQRHRLHDVGVRVRSMHERADAVAHAVLVDVDEQIEAELARHLVAKLDHLTELPGRIDMEKRERRLGGIESLNGQMHEHGGILAHGIEHHRLGEGRRHLAENVDRLGFEPIEMGKFCQHFSSKRESDARLARGMARPDIRMPEFSQKAGLSQDERYQNAGECRPELSPDAVSVESHSGETLAMAAGGKILPQTVPVRKQPADRKFGRSAKALNAQPGLRSRMG